MVVAFRDKDGNLYSGSVSQPDGDRISQEIALHGYAEPPKEWISDSIDIDDASKHDPDADGDATIGVVDIGAAERGELSGNLNENADLPEKLGLIKADDHSAYARCLREIVRGFGDIHIGDEDAIENNIDWDSSDAIITLTGNGKDINDIELSTTIFKDIIRNFALGHGSVFELLQYDLASRRGAYIHLYLSNSISFETLQLQIAEAYPFDADEEAQWMAQRIERNEEYATAAFDNDVKWSGNVIVRDYWGYWNPREFRYQLIITGLSEQAWKDEILTDRMDQIASEFQ